MSDALRRIAGEINQRDNLTRSLNLARKRQQMMLPRKIPEIPGASLGMAYRPAEDISGDFYDVIVLNEGRVGILLGDVSGHGIEAALVMGMAKKSLQIWARGQDNPAEVLAIANEDICPDLDNETFLTGVYAILSPHEQTLQFCRAGHPHPILCNPARDPSVSLLKSGGMIIGMDGGGAAFRAAAKNMEISVQSGDVFVVHTDGIDECRSPAGEEFGVGRIMDTVEKNAHLGAQEIADAMERTVVEYSGREDQNDDVTVVVLKIE